MSFSTITTLDTEPAIPRRWRVKGMLAEDEATMFVAAGGTGKGVFFARLAAILTTGDTRPGEPAGTRHDPETVVVIAPEDHTNKDLRPRFDAAGVDARYVIVASFHDNGMPWTLADLDELSEQIKAIADPDNEEFAGMPEVGLVIIDPLMKVLRTRPNGTRETVAARDAANQIMLEIQTFAAGTEERKGVSVAVAHHTNWDGGVNGSRGLLDSLRLTFRIDVAKDDPDARVITSIKANNTKRGEGLRYVITEADNGAPVAELVDYRAQNERRIEAAKRRLALEAGPSDALSAPQSAPKCRAIRMVDRPGYEPERTILGDADGIAGARRLCQSDPYATLAKLLWTVTHPGMEVAARMLPDSTGTVKYAAYELTEQPS